MNFHWKKLLNVLKMCCNSERVKMSVHMHKQIGRVPLQASGPDAVITVKSVIITHLHAAERLSGKLFGQMHQC